MQTPAFRHLSLMLALSWAVFIFYLSSQPGVDMPPLFIGQDKMFHFIAFGILGFLAMGTAKAGPYGHRPWQAWLATALVTLYGMLDEFHQYFVPGRVADLYDVIADMVGGMFGAWMMYFLLSRRHEKCRSER